MNIPIEIAQKQLLDLINDVIHGKHIILTKGNEPIAELVPVNTKQSLPVFGSAKGWFEMKDDFDEPLNDFEEYMH